MKILQQPYVVRDRFWIGVPVTCACGFGFALEYSDRDKVEESPQDGSTQFLVNCHACGNKITWDAGPHLQQMAREEMSRQAVATSTFEANSSHGTTPGLIKLLRDAYCHLPHPDDLEPHRAEEIRSSQKCILIALNLLGYTDYGHADPASAPSMPSNSPDVDARCNRCGKTGKAPVPCIGKSCCTELWGGMRCYGVIVSVSGAGQRIDGDGADAVSSPSLFLEPENVNPGYGRKQHVFWNSRDIPGKVHGCVMADNEGAWIDGFDDPFALTTEAHVEEFCAVLGAAFREHLRLKDGAR